MIRIDGVSKAFGRKVAVDDLTLEIKPGEFFAVLGPNGAGKTTTIKMIAGLLKPTSGTISVCGFDVQKDPIEAKRVMSYVPDQPYLYDKLSGLEFLHFVADMYRLDGADRAKEIDRLVDLFSMGDYVRELTEGYSHGMKQRVVLAATLLHKPKAMVVDEPLVGLDPHSSRLVKDIFAAEAKRGCAIFMSTHVISIAEETAGRIGIITGGRLRAVGTMDELRKLAGTDGGLEKVFFKLTDGEAGTPVSR
ncbi:MAG: ABC transporter ATP-binding protein [Planctomycetes bacterium]|nr:ABC transporter ATP-binding protein [Planctomycetota bacterium]